jgi:uncharacterized protein (TIGR02265 family)
VAGARPSKPPRRFVEPPWDAPLDGERELLAIPESALVRGLLIAPMIAENKRRGIARQPPRPRYVTFNQYPLRELARVMLDHCHDVFPDLPLRTALRKIGRAAATAFVGSTVGKVTLGSAEGIHDVVAAFAKGYELSLQPGSATVIEQSAKHMIVTLDQVYHFIDSHHIGAFEGALKRAGVRGKITIAARPPSADLLLEW